MRTTSLSSVDVETEAQQWTARQLQFIAWRANPFERVPPTQQELAKQLGVSERTLNLWARRSGFDEAVAAVAIDMVRKDVPRLLRAGVKHALNGKYQYWAALMRMAGLEVDGDKATDTRTQIAIIFGDGQDARNVTVDSAPWARSGTGEAQQVQRSLVWPSMGQNGNGYGPDGDGSDDER